MTSRASPKLASHAPNVKIIINKNGSHWVIAPHVNIEKQANDSIIASKDRRDIKKCFRWYRREEDEEIKDKAKINEESIAERRYIFSI